MFLAAWATEQETGPALHQAANRAARARREGRVVRSPETEMRVARELLLGVWTQILKEGLTVGEAMGWLTVYACAGTDARRAAVDALFDGWAAAAPVVGWRPVGALAPLAFVAGLSLAEARERAAAETWTAPGLLMMAGLRGFRLPPLHRLPTVGS